MGSAPRSGCIRVHMVGRGVLTASMVPGPELQAQADQPGIAHNAPGRSLWLELDSFT